MSAMDEMLTHIPENIVAMGNVDPAGVLRMSDADTVRNVTIELLDKCSKYPNFVLSSGCDMPPMTPWENIDAFIKAAEDFKKGN